MDILNEERFGFISETDKGFIHAFNEEMSKLGYNFGDKIDSGYCWGKYMILYRKSGVKRDKVFARIYIRDTEIVLRLFFNDIDKYCEFIENAPSHIKDVFIGEDGNCQHCHNDKDGVCRFRKTYTIDNRLIEKCNGITFEFQNPNIQRLPDYIALFTEFYPSKKERKSREISLNTKEQHMKDLQFVPTTFEVPSVFETERFRLRMLSVKDVEIDYEAVIESRELLHSFGSTWPREGFTIEENLADLEQHQQEFMDRQAFAYTVVALDEGRVLGCVYINPTNRAGADVEIRMWVRKSEYDRGLDEILFHTVKKWINSTWPFSKAAYPGRES
jgi:RimJ/RimL family protein N-acetyltransferase